MNLLEKSICELNDVVERNESIDHHKKIKDLENALPFLDKIKNSYLVLRTKINYANELYFANRYDEGLVFATNLYEVTKTVDDKQFFMRSCNILGNLKSATGYYKNALEYYYEALEVCNHLETKINYQVILVNNIASLYSELEIHTLAIEYFEEALSLSQKEGNDKISFLIAYNLVENFIKTNELAKAKKYVDFAEHKIELKKFSNINKGLLCVTKARYERACGNDECAKSYIDDALRLIKLDGEVSAVSDALVEYAHINFNLKDYSRSLATSLELLESNHDFDKKRSILKLICTLYDLKGDLAHSYLYYKKLTDVNEELIKQTQELFNYQTNQRSRYIVQNLRNNEMEKLLNNMRFIHDISKDISRELDYNSLVKLIIDKLCGFVEFDALVIGLYDDEKEVIFNRMIYHRGEISSQGDVRIDNRSSLASWTIRHNKEIYTGLLTQLVLDDFEPLKNNFPGLEVPYETVIYLPLIDGEKIIGIFSLQKFERDGFDHFELEMLRAISSYIGIALINSGKNHQLVELNLKLENVSRSDGLSGLLNRNALNSDLYQLIECMKNSSDLSEMTLIMCDIDYFKEYNDQYGHIEGDTVIKTISKIIIESTKDYSPYVYRYGGDEFLILCPGVNRATASEISNKLLLKIRNEHILHSKFGQDGEVTLSIGAAFFSGKSFQFDEDVLLKRVDDALYKAKRNGRNQIYFAEDKYYEN